MARFVRGLGLLPLLLVTPILLLTIALTLLICDALWALFGSSQRPPDVKPSTKAATVIIPNWNGKDLLEKYLPSVVEALAGNPANELIVVDNGSSDGSADFVRQYFPSVNLLALQKNLGFGGGCNAGAHAAKNDIIVLLNSDMRVDPGFLEPLLDGFTDELTFAVSCQIFFSDPSKLREETGLTQASWGGGRLRVRHRIDNDLHQLYPCFYGGGGSTAFDRKKLLELGGFDHLLRPFYLEDTDLGYVAWKRGWKVLYQPASIVFHEHRGTIGKKFSPAYIRSILSKNFLLFTWKNIHSWRMLAAHFGWTLADGALDVVAGHSPERASLAGLWRAAAQLPELLAARWRSRSFATVSDQEAFRRPLAGYFRDRFTRLPAKPERLSVLFISPYPICPPVHGGGVFMYQTTMELAKLCDLHLIVLLDAEEQRAPHTELVERCASATFLVRMTGRRHTFASIVPHAVSEFANGDLEWLIHRQIYLQSADVLQLEYMPLGQYAGRYHQIPSIVFEHDVYFQSVGRQWRNMTALLSRLQAGFEYLRAFRYELKMLPKTDRIQVCSQANAEHITSFSPALATRIDADLRAGIEVDNYQFQSEGREPNTLLFLGSFRHLPNQEALQWFLRHVMPLVLEDNPEAKLVVIGSDPPASHSLPVLREGSVELKGFVQDIMEPLRRYAVFICPILSGSGVRVKLLEAFAAGIPVVSTGIGAEGLADVDGEVCALADDPQGFADRVVKLLADQAEARQLAERARAYVEEHRNMRRMTHKLEQNYRAAVLAKRTTAS